MIRFRVYAYAYRNRTKFIFSTALHLYVVFYIFITSTGKIIGQVCPAISEIPIDLRTRIPWTAALYSKPGPNLTFKFLITGTILGPSTVLTVFGSPLNGSQFSPDHLLVGAGLLSSNLKTADQFAQLRDVQSLTDYQDGLNNSLFNYYLLTLKSPFNFSTPYVRRICIGNPLISKDISLFGLNLIIGGYSLPRGSDGGLVLSTQLLYPKYKEECEAEYNLHYRETVLESTLICGKIYSEIGDNDNNDAQCFLHGSTGFILVENAGILGGVIGLIRNNMSGSSCNREGLYFLSSIQTPLKWINKVLSNDKKTLA